jgi:hypothetical protein
VGLVDDVDHARTELVEGFHRVDLAEPELELLREQKAVGEDVSYVRKRCETGAGRRGHREPLSTAL